MSLDDEFQKNLRRALREKKPALSPELEGALFAKAEELLSARRERLALSESRSSRNAQARARTLAGLREFRSRALELFAIHPGLPAAVATLTALILAFLTLHSGHAPPMNLTYADLPDFPRFNDVPRKYDEQRLAERQAYEREVEYAHQSTSGGI